MVPFFSDANHMTFNGKSNSSFGILLDFCYSNQAVKNSPAVSNTYNLNIYALKKFKIPALRNMHCY